MSVKSSNTARLLLKELPYFGINFIPIHGQFNNSTSSFLPTKKYLEKLTSFHEKKSNIICGIIYRQHNSPESFQAYFDEALERFSQSDKAVYVMGDFNINLLNAETCNFTKEFLLA